MLEEVATPLAVALAAFAVGFGVSFSLTPVTSKLARRFEILDRPEIADYKGHDGAIPYLGGVAIFGGCVLGSSFLVFTDTPTDTSIARILLILGVALGLGLVGLLDDIRSLPRSLRLGAQGLAAVGGWFAGFRAQPTGNDAVDFLITMAWIIGITNSFNLLDNMDGLSAGLAGVGALSFTVIGIVGDIPEVVVVAAALAGAAFGFLAHNRHPAKVFMGDAGSTFLGFLLALLGIKLRFDNLIQVTFLVPVVVLGLPIFDTTLVVLSRLLHKRPVFLGGRDHTSHRLVAVGLPVKAAVGLLYFSGLCLGWLGLVIARANVEVGWMLLGFVIALGLFFGGVLLRVPVYEAREVVTPVRGSTDPDELLSSREPA